MTIKIRISRHGRQNTKGILLKMIKRYSKDYYATPVLQVQTSILEKAVTKFLYSYPPPPPPPPPPPFRSKFGKHQASSVS